MTHRRRRSSLAAVVLVLGSLVVACGDETAEGGGFVGDEDTSTETPATETPATTETPSPTSSPTGAASVAIEGDGTWEVGSDVEPGVYVAEGGEGCEWQRISEVGANYVQVEARGFLARPVVEIMAGDEQFKSEKCGAWTALEDYAGLGGTEIPGDGIWIVGADVAPGDYEAEGGAGCTWQRISGFEPDISSVIKIGYKPKVTLEAGDLAFVTELCGSWTSAAQ